MFGSDDSFGAVGPEAVVAKLQGLAALSDPVPSLEKMCSTYELVELEGAHPELFQQGVACLAAGLAAEAVATRQAYSEALLLTIKAMQVRSS